jgi:hypothetical protein
MKNITLMKTSKRIEDTYVAIIISWSRDTMQGGKMDQWDIQLGARKAEDFKTCWTCEMKTSREKTIYLQVKIKKTSKI